MDAIPDARSSSLQRRLAQADALTPFTRTVGSDVDRLIALSQSVPIEHVAVDAIGEIDSAYWFDGSDEVPTVRKVVEHARLISEVDVSCPIILGPDGRVMDGMHRIARALLERRPQTDAVRFTALPEPDYRCCWPRELPY